jgi:hypothetical protein
MKKVLFTLGLLLTFSAIMAKPPLQAIPLTSDTTDLEQYAGVYQFDGQFSSATLIIKDKDLYGEVDSYGSNKLIAEPEKDTFKSTSTYGTIYFFLRDPASQAITGLTLKLMGQEIVGKKVKQ